MNKRMHVGPAILLALVFSGCSATLQTRDAATSGFLGNYSQLQPGTGDQAQFVYTNPKANWKQYTKLMVDPVRVYASADKIGRAHV